MFMLQELRLKMLRIMRGWTPPQGEPPYEPDIGVREPKRHGPAGRGAAVAVEEPGPDRFIDAIGAAPRNERSR
jgi:hypothetical protein